MTRTADTSGAEATVLTELRALLDRLDGYYDFTCGGGPLRNCVEWQQLRSLLLVSESHQQDEELPTDIDTLRKRALRRLREAPEETQKAIFRAVLTNHPVVSESLPDNGRWNSVARTVSEQAEDDGLWFVAKTAPEAYLQAALRRLHSIIEAPAAIREQPLVTEAERTVASIAAMLGWENVPPRETLERDIAALKSRPLVSESHQPEKPWCQICGVELGGLYCETCQRALSESHQQEQEHLNDGTGTCRTCGHPESTHNLTGLGECYFSLRHLGRGLCQCPAFVTESHPSDRLRERMSLVAGVYMDRSIADFQRSCEAHIEEEQRKPNPDTALIALLCDAVRCSRELTVLATKMDAVDPSNHHNALACPYCNPDGALVRASQPSEGWQPIETAVEEDVLLVYDEGYIGKAMLTADRRWLDVECGRDDAFFDPPPTHWQPLPAPPSLVRVIAETTREGRNNEELARVAPLDSSTDRISANPATGDK